MLYTTRKKWSIFALLKHMCRTAKNVKILHSDYDLKPFFNVLMTPSWFCWKWHKNTHTKLWNKTTDFCQCQLIFIFKIRCLKARKPWLKVAEKKTNQTFFVPQSVIFIEPWFRVEREELGAFHLFMLELHYFRGL